MRTFTVRLLLGILFLVAGGTAAHAQCFPTSINYLTTTSIVLDIPTSNHPPAHLYVTTQISGTANMYPNTCGTITHTAKAYTVIDGVGGWVTGTTGCPSCYISASNFQSQNWVDTPGGEIDTGSLVVCSKVGNFGGANPPTRLERIDASTKLKVGAQVDANRWSVSPWCNNTGAPDYHPVKLYTSTPPPHFTYYWGFSICTRPWMAQSGTLFDCTDNNKIIIESLLPSQEICTAKDIGYPYDYFPWADYIIQTGLKWLLH